MTATELFVPSKLYWSWLYILRTDIQAYLRRPIKSTSTELNLLSLELCNARPSPLPLNELHQHHCEWLLPCFFFFPSLLVNYTNCRFIVHGYIIYIYLQLYLIYEFVYIIYRQNIWSVIELLLLSKAMHVQCLRERERGTVAAAAASRDLMGETSRRQTRTQNADRRRWRREAEPARFSQWILKKAEHTTRTHCSFKISAHYCCFHFTDRALPNPSTQRLEILFLPTTSPCTSTQYLLSIF